MEMSAHFSHNPEYSITPYSVLTDNTQCEDPNPVDIKKFNYIENTSLPSPLAYYLINCMCML